MSSKHKQTKKCHENITERTNVMKLTPSPKNLS